MTSNTAETMSHGLSHHERQAMRGFFFTDAVGERLLARGLFASREGWPMTKLGGQVQRALFAERSPCS